MLSHVNKRRIQFDPRQRDPEDSEAAVAAEAAPEAPKTVTLREIDDALRTKLLSTPLYTRGLEVIHSGRKTRGTHTQTVTVFRSVDGKVIKQYETEPFNPKEFGKEDCDKIVFNVKKEAYFQQTVEELLKKEGLLVQEGLSVHSVRCPQLYGVYLGDYMQQLVMEFIETSDIKVLKEIRVSVINALEKRTNVYHNDPNSGNVKYGADGRTIVVMDFGSADYFINHPRGGRRKKSRNKRSRRKRFTKSKF